MALWYGATVGVLTIGLSVFLYYRLERDLTKHYGNVLQSYSGDLRDVLLEQTGEWVDWTDAEIAGLSEELGNEIAHYRPLSLLLRVEHDGRMIYETEGWGASSMADLGWTPAQRPADRVSIPGHRTPFLCTGSEVVDPSGDRLRMQVAISTRPIKKTLLNYQRNALMIFVPLVGLAVPRARGKVVPHHEPQHVQPDRHGRGGGLSVQCHRGPGAADLP